MVRRLESFYILAEKYRLQGPTSQQLESFRKTGYKFEYHIELHKCLKKLVIRVINQKDAQLQLLYLKEVYSWFNDKLITMGLLSKRD